MTARRSLWFVATSGAIVALVLSFRPVPAPAEPQGRFDEPGAAAQHDLMRRIPADGSSMPLRYAAAERRLGELSRFASRIDRFIPSAQAATRVWMDGTRVIPAGA